MPVENPGVNSALQHQLACILQYVTGTSTQVSQYAIMPAVSCAVQCYHAAMATWTSMY